MITLYKLNPNYDITIEGDDPFLLVKNKQGKNLLLGSLHAAGLDHYFNLLYKQTKDQDFKKMMRFNNEKNNNI